MLSKSIEQLENDYWSDQFDFPSSVVVNCHKYRKIPIKELTIEQLRLLISQQIGLKYIVELSIKELQKNILAEGDFYEGDLLMAVSKIPQDYWNNNIGQLNLVNNLVYDNMQILIDKLGAKKLDELTNHFNNQI